MGWPAARDELEKALIAQWVPGGPSRPGSTGVTSYRSWLTLWKWARLLATDERDAAREFTTPRLTSRDGEIVSAPPGWEVAGGGVSNAEANAAFANADRARNLASSGIPNELLRLDGQVAARLQPEICREWTADPELLGQLFDYLSDGDYAPGVLEVLQQIRVAHPARFKEYRSLALAIALVYDQNFPPDWPHKQVEASLVPRSKANPPEWFAEWIATNESKNLLLDLRTLDPSEAKRVIDAPLDPAEFEWARRNVRTMRSNLGKVFGLVPYADGRLRTLDYVWHDGEYSLEAIRRNGGICVDQAYFSMIAGKARGIPTLFFTGQGSDGGHAWFGYLKTGAQWELNCGRYENQGYATGYALDPQTWRRASDHEIKQLSVAPRERELLLAARNDLLIASLFAKSGDTVRALKACDSALSVYPRDPAAWRAKTALLEATDAKRDVLRAHLGAGLKEFVTDRDSRAEFQIALAALARETGDLRQAAEIEDQIVTRNKARRPDLGVGVAAGRLAALVGDKQLTQAFEEYKKLAGSLGKTGGGGFFYEVVEPLARIYLAAGDSSRARETVSLARKVLKPSASSILDEELKALDREISESTGGRAGG